MNKKRKNLIWNVVYVLVIIGIGYFIYMSSIKINYIWRWKRVPSFIVYKTHNDVESPARGIVENYRNKILYIKTLDGKIQKVKVDYPSVKKGDAVDTLDELGYNSSYQSGPLLVGLYITLKISFLAIIAAIIIGIVTGLMRISSNPLFRNLAITYVELIRGTPLLVQIFIFYFFIGTVFHLDRLVAGVGALAVFEGAYIAEIIRAGIQSVDKGQREAAVSLGMNYYQVMRHIIMPQAIKRTLPATAGQFISLVKDSSLVSVISITDLTKSGREIITSTFSPFEIWFTVAAMYLIVTYSLSLVTQYLERRMARSE